MSSCYDTHSCLLRDLKLMRAGVRDACFHCFCKYDPDDLKVVFEQIRKRRFYITQQDECRYGYFISTKSLLDYNLKTDSWKILGYTNIKTFEQSSNQVSYRILVDGMTQWGPVYIPKDEDIDHTADYVFELAKKFKKVLVGCKIEVSTNTNYSI